MLRAEREQPGLTTYRALHVWDRGLLRWCRTPRTRTVCLPDSSNYWCLRTPSTDARNSTAQVLWSLLQPLTASTERRSHAATTRQSCATRCRRLVRCEGVGQEEKCNHSSLTGFPGWADEMGWLQAAQTGAIKASLRPTGRRPHLR